MYDILIMGKVSYYVEIEHVNDLGGSIAINYLLGMYDMRVVSF